MKQFELLHTFGIRFMQKYLTSDEGITSTATSVTVTVNIVITDVSPLKVFP